MDEVLMLKWKQDIVLKYLSLLETVRKFIILQFTFLEQMFHL